MKNKNVLFFIAAALLFGVTVVAMFGSPRVLVARLFEGVSPPSDVAKTELASCLSEKGVIMYGAWWCPHCANQKEAFGDAFSEINSIECSSAGQRDRLPECVDAGIKGYPTWIFPDGTQLSGEQPLSELAQRAGWVFEE